MNTRLAALAFISVVGISSAAYADSASSSIRQQIAAAAFYPEAAIDRAAEGTVGVAVVIGANGAIADAIVEKSSGKKSLDEAAIAAVRAAAPFTTTTTTSSGTTVVHTKFKYVLND